MIQSMTGFGKAETTHKDFSCRIELRSVNHKFLDARIKLPKEFQYFEETLKGHLKELVKRGKVDITIVPMETQREETKLAVDEKVWANTMEILQRLEFDMGDKIALSFSDIRNVPGLLRMEEPPSSVEDWEILFQQALQEGAENLVEMRMTEGGHIRKELFVHLENCRNMIDEVTDLATEVGAQYRQRLAKNLENLGINFERDDPRIIQEIGIAIDRSDITEEINRFRAHLSQFTDLLNQSAPVGRKMDFLLQELNREANTLCSKANHVQISSFGIDLKCEIEKMREQSLNVQ